MYRMDRFNRKKEHLKVARTAMIDETNPYLRQGSDDH